MNGEERIASSESPEESDVTQRDSKSSPYGLIMYCGLEKESSEEI